MYVIAKKRRRTKPFSLFLKLLVVLLGLFMIFKIAMQQVTIDKKVNELNQINTQINQQIASNALATQQKENKNNSLETLTSEARAQLAYSLANERVYVNVSGN